MPAVSFSDSHSVERFDPRQLPTAFYADPYPTYHDLRRTAPVFRCPDGTFFLTAHADLDRVYRDPRTFSSDKQQQFRPVFGDSPLYEHHTTSLVFNDPPLHTHVRKAVGDALTWAPCCWTHARMRSTRLPILRAIFRTSWSP